MESFDLIMELEPNAGQDLFGLFESDSVGPGTSLTLRHGATLTLSDSLLRKSVDAGTVILIILTIPSTVEAVVELAERLTTRGPRPETVRRATLDRETVEFTKGELVRAIREHMVLEEDDGQERD